MILVAKSMQSHARVDDNVLNFLVWCLKSARNLQYSARIDYSGSVQKELTIFRIPFPSYLRQKSNTYSIESLNYYRQSDRTQIESCSRLAPFFPPPRRINEDPTLERQSRQKKKKQVYKVT